MDLLLEYGTEAVRKAVERHFKRLGPGLVKTITFDPGKENAGHKTLERYYLVALEIVECHIKKAVEKMNPPDLVFTINNGKLSFKVYYYRRIYR
jgi:hypothetical protein